MLPENMFLIITIFFILIMVVSKILDKSNRLTEKIRENLALLMIGSLTFWLISFSAIIGPNFFKSMNYNVTDTGYTITAFDATNCVLSSLFAVVIGYFFFNLSRK